MYKKELLLRAGAIVLSASLAMSSPIAVLAEGNVTSDQIESSVTKEVTVSDWVDVIPEEESPPDADKKQPDSSDEGDVSPPREDDSSDSGKAADVSTPSDADEVEDEELDNDTEVKQFTIKVVDHLDLCQYLGHKK